MSRAVQALRPAPKVKLSDDQLAFAALAGGALSALATIPMDVLVSTKQAASKAGHNVSILETFREQVRAGGVVGTVKFACRGLVARVWHVACTTFMMRFMTTRVCESAILHPAEVSTVRCNNFVQQEPIHGNRTLSPSTCSILSCR